MSYYPAPYERTGYAKPSKATCELIKQARQALPVDERQNIYSICRKFNDLALDKYVGKNYYNQFSRMKIHTTHDMLAKIEWYLMNEED